MLCSGTIFHIFCLKKEQRSPGAPHKAWWVKIAGRGTSVCQETLNQSEFPLCLDAFKLDHILVITKE